MCHDFCSDKVDGLSSCVPLLDYKFPLVMSPCWTTNFQLPTSAGLIVPCQKSEATVLLQEGLDAAFLLRVAQGSSSGDRGAGAFGDSSGDAKAGAGASSWSGPSKSKQSKQGGDAGAVASCW